MIFVYYDENYLEFKKEIDVLAVKLVRGNYVPKE